MNHLVQYIAAALLNSANHSGNSKARLSRFVREDYEIYRGSISKIVEQLKSQFGPHISENDVDQALQLLNLFAAAEPEFSPAARAFWNIKFDNFRYYFIEDEPDAKDDDPNLYDELRKSAENEAILMAYARNGSAYIEDAIEHIAQMSEEQVDELRRSSKVTAHAPASDRLVSLNHNQIPEWDGRITELVDALEKDNGSPDSPSLRERLLGQIKAGRELVRAGEFRAYLLYETLVRALSELIEKYGNPTIKALANALLGAIVSQWFEAN